MKTVFAAICLLLFVSTPTKAAFTETNAETDKALSVAEQWEPFSTVYALVNLSRKKYEQLTGRRLSLVERIGLKLAQHRLKSEWKQYKPPGASPQQFFEHYLAPRKGKEASTVLLVVVIVLLLLLLIPLLFIGKWK